MSPKFLQVSPESELLQRHLENLFLIWTHVPYMGYSCFKKSDQKYNFKSSHLHVAFLQQFLNSSPIFTTTTYKAPWEKKVHTPKNVISCPKGSNQPPFESRFSPGESVCQGCQQPRGICASSIQRMIHHSIQ